MRPLLKWSLLLTLLGACSLINDPTEHQASDSDADVALDGAEADAPSSDGFEGDMRSLDSGPSPDTSPAEDTGPADVRPPEDTGSEDTGPVEDTGPPPQDAGNDAGPPSLTASEYCERFAELMCLANVACCEDREEAFTDCQPRIRRECEDIHGPTPSLPESLMFDGVRAAEVITTLEPLVDACDTDVVLWLVDDFVAPLIGTRAPLVTCTPENITARDVVHAGLSCDRSTQADAICQPAMGTRWQCERRRPADSPCFLGLQCLTHRCTPPLVLPEVLPGTCSDGLANGSECQPERSDQCSSLVCQESGPRWNCVPRTPESVYCRTM